VYAAGLDPGEHARLRPETVRIEVPPVPGVKPAIATSCNSRSADRGI